MGFHYGSNVGVVSPRVMNGDKKKYYLIVISVACAFGPSVTASSIDFSFQNLVLKNLFEFSVAEITSKLISVTF
jgi:hypothetical protein